MRKREIKSYLNDLKMHIDHMERWMDQATNMIYEIEERLSEEDEPDEFELAFSKLTMVS